MESEIFYLPAFEDNYIWCLRSGNDIVVVDPGDAEPVLCHLADTGQRLRAILITHHHRDHTGGVATLCRNDAIPVFGPAAENIAGVNSPVIGGDRIRIPGVDSEWEVLDVAGHTRGHVAYYRRGTLFCGDTLFGCGCGRLFEGTPGQLHAALSRIAALPPETQVYCAHEYTASGIRFAKVVEPGNPAVAERGLRVAERLAQGLSTVPFSLTEELATNPFLRCREEEVSRSAAAYRGTPVTSELAVFATLRQWRDNF